MDNRLPQVGWPALNLDYIYGETDRALATLKHNGGFQTALQHIERLKHSPRGTLALVEPAIQENQSKEVLWEELALLCALDDITFIHSMAVTRLLYNMQTQEGATRTYLLQQFSSHEASLSDGALYIAGLLHDVGKRIIREVIHDQRKKREWALLVNQVTGGNIFDPWCLLPVEAGGLSDTALETYFHEIGIDPIDIIPIEHAFPKDILETLERRGIPSSSTFRQVIELHEVGTYYLLQHHPEMGSIAEIAAWHHNCQERPIETEVYPAALSALRIAVNQCIHVADIFEALVSGYRSYKGRFHPLMALQIIVRDTEKHSIDPNLTRAFVKDWLASDTTPVNDPSLIEAHGMLEEFCAV